MKNLNAATIALHGKHLIEASAGTGKTHNITRIFLRLLLERQLPVEQILVMTFTKDATEEIRGRIDSFIRQVLHDWDQLSESDDYFVRLAKTLQAQGIGADEVKARLTQALLYIDEAAIFTIHGFCKRVLNQYAFASGINFNAQMETDTQDITLEACQDWYRVLALNSADDFNLVAEFWPEPLTYISQFSKALNRSNNIEVQNPDTISIAFTELVEQAIANLEQNNATLTSALIAVKKGAEREKRSEELAALLRWLGQLGENVQAPISKMPDSFIDGRRYSRSALKHELSDIFTAVNAVKKQLPLLAKKVNRAKALLIVRQGIYQIRAQIAQQKLRSNVMGFDDLITTLTQCLANESEHELANSIYKQFPVALIDEFQDTDPQQFSILKAIYYHQKTPALYMIGDPKQAIYGFRGGDVFAYLSARNDCDEQWLMDTNWRSSAEMVTAYNRLFYGNNLQESAKEVFGYQIPYLPVKASPLAATKGFEDGEFNALQFVHFAVELSGRDKAVKQSYRENMAAWCANEIVRLLSLESLAIKSGDIALLVRDGSEAASVKQALTDCGLASVFMSNRANLLQSAQTRQLLQVLKGILFLENDRLYTAALASAFMGFDAAKLLQLQNDESHWQRLKDSFEKLRNEWQYKGFIAMALQLMHEHFVIRDEDKDRVLTNLLHLFELLQSASQRHRQPQELLYWFEQQSQIDNPEVEAELRLESDDNLIRIITQHGSKGMEYPVVFVPFATRHKDPLKFGSRHVSLIEYHDDSGELHHSLDGDEQIKARMADEAYAEAIRLLYVAVTRAEKRCYLLTTAFDGCENSPLGKTLKWAKGQDIGKSLAQLQADNQAEIGLLMLNDYQSEHAMYDGQAINAAPDVARFNGKIERDWWLSSFSALSKNLRHNGVSAPDRDVQESVPANLIDNIESVVIPAVDELRFTLAKGAHTGNLLHDILEHTDFTAPDWQQSCHWPLLKYGRLSLAQEGSFTERNSESDSDSLGDTDESRQSQLIQWLEQILMAPLSCEKRVAVEQEQLCLAQLNLLQTLRETEFYYPMNNANSQQLTKLLTRHRALDINGESTRNGHVHLPSYQQLKGMMHGFIDLIFEANGKFYVCDYKSSHLGENYQDYNHQAMRNNIEKNHYDLQYLIYALALHRHLRYAMPDYDPAQHFGGVYYLYLRGMTNTTEHLGCGVYQRNISLVELAELDEIFAGENINA